MKRKQIFHKQIFLNYKDMIVRARDIVAITWGITWATDGPEYFVEYEIYLRGGHKLKTMVPWPDDELKKWSVELYDEIARYMETLDVNERECGVNEK